MAQLLKVHQVAKGYRRFLTSPMNRVLESIDFSLRRGEVAGLYGANGSGKTTLTRLLVGLTSQDSGNITVLGESPSRALKLGFIGYVPERERLPGYMTPKSMLRIRLRGSQNEPDDSWLSYLTESLDLSNLMARPVRELSKGQRQRVSILLALAPLPPLVVMDEPTDGLDPVSRVRVRDIVRELSAKNVGVLMNSHLVDETQAACESYAILHGGLIRERGRSDALRSEVSSWQVSFAKMSKGQEADLESLGLPTPDDRGFVRAPASSLEELNGFIRKAQDAGLLLSAIEPERHPIEDKLAALAAEGSSL